MQEAFVLPRVDEHDLDFEACRFDFRIDCKNGLTPSKRKKGERKNNHYNTLFKCKFCGNLFDSRPALLEHKLEHTNQQRCTICDAKFSRRAALKEHLNTAHKLGKRDIAIAPASKKDIPPNVADLGNHTASSTPVVQEVGSPSPMTSSTSVPQQGYICINVPIYYSTPGSDGSVTTTSHVMSNPIASPMLTGMLPMTSQHDSTRLITVPANYQGPTVPNRSPCSYVPAAQDDLEPGEIRQMPYYSKDTPCGVVNPNMFHPIDPNFIGPNKSDLNPVKPMHFPSSFPAADGKFLYPNKAETEICSSPNENDGVTLGIADLVHNTQTNSAVNIETNASHECEILDFSRKTENTNRCKSAGIYPVRERTTPLTDVSKSDSCVLDLSRPRKSPPVQISSTQQDDAIAMKREYSECDSTNSISSVTKMQIDQNDIRIALLKKIRKSGSSSSLTSLSDKPNESESPARPQIEMPKQKRKSCLDLMVNKLWKSKIKTSDIVENENNKELPSALPKFKAKDFHIEENEPQPIESHNLHTGSALDALDLSVQNGMCKLDQEMNGIVQRPEMMQVPLNPEYNLTPGLPSDITESPPVIKDSGKSGNYFTLKFHTCKVCKQLFDSVEKMWEHAVTHKGERFTKYKCRICCYVTGSRSDLSHHWHATHSHQNQSKALKDKSASPPLATAGFSQMLQSVSKQWTATSERRSVIECDFPGCDKTFREWRHLKAHQTIHTGEKPLACSLCNYACRHRSALNWHMKSRHGLDKMRTAGNRTVYVNNEGQVVVGLQSKDSQNTMEIDSTEIDESSQTSGSVSNYSLDTEQSPDKEIKKEEPVMESELGKLSEVVEREVCQPVTSELRQAGIHKVSQSTIDELRLTASRHLEERPLDMSFKMTGSQSPNEDAEMANPGTKPLHEISDYEPSTTCLTPQEAAVFPTLVPSQLPFMNGESLKPIGDAPAFYTSVMKLKYAGLSQKQPLESYHVCKVCNKTFDTAENLWEHRVKVHEEMTQFYCDNCGFDTESKAELQSHMMSTHGKEMGEFKEFLCFICGKGYSSKTGLNHHLLRHSEEGPARFVCPFEECLCKLHSKGALKHHIRRVHQTSQGLLACSQEGCERTFDSVNGLRMHQSLHIEERLLYCDHPGCDKSFRESKHLKVHKMQHTDERPLKCLICDYSCRQRNSMNWHMKSKHGKDKHVDEDGKTIYI